MEDPEHVVHVEGDKGVGVVFVLPPCYLNRGSFSWENYLGLHEEEREATLSKDKETLRKNLSDDVAAVMRVLETPLMLNDEVAGAQAAFGIAYSGI